MIPKLLHFIWLGNNPKPTSWINTWKKICDDYEIKIWTDDDVEKLNIMNENIYKEVCDKKGFRYNQKSDILRLEILYKYGGVYIDCDIICVKKIDKLLDDEFFIFQEKKNLLSNSVVGAIKNNQIIKGLIDELPKKFDINESIWKSTGPRFLTNYLINNGYCNISGINFETNCDDLVIHPYYYINICQDNSKTFIAGDDDFKSYEKNKDLKYLRKGFKINVGDIYGFQIWCGGKKFNYALNSNFKYDIFKRRLDNYLNYLFSIK